MSSVQDLKPAVEQSALDNEIEWLKSQMQKENYYELKSRFKIVGNESDKEIKPFDFIWIY